MDKIGKIINKAGAEAYARMNVGAKSSSDAIATALTSALTTTAKIGLDEQVALITVMDHIQTLDDKYSWIDKGSLEFGVGETFLTAGIKASTKFDANGEWVPNGPVKSLEKYQSTTTGYITRQAENQYSIMEMKKYFRDANTFSELLAKELAANSFTHSREGRELKRYLFGVQVDAKYLPADYSSELDPVKSLIGQNKIDVTVTNRKEVVNYLREFADEMYVNISDKYNMASKTPGGNLFINNVDTGVKALDNTWRKEDTVLIMSIKFVNKLKQELGNTYNPEYWNDFTSLFGHVIVDSLPNEGDIFLVDKKAIRRKVMFDEFSSTYYPRKRAFDNVGVWRETFAVVPWLNCVKFNFTGMK